MTLNTLDAAKLLGLSPSTLEKWRVYGIGPVYLKLNRAVRYRQSDLEEWLSGNLVSSTSAARLG